MWHLPTFGSNWTRATMEMVMNGTKRIEKQRESVRRMVWGMQVSFLKNQSGGKKEKKEWEITKTNRGCETLPGIPDQCRTPETPQKHTTTDTHASIRPSKSETRDASLEEIIGKLQRQFHRCFQFDRLQTLLFFCDYRVFKRATGGARVHTSRVELGSRFGFLIEKKPAISLQEGEGWEAWGEGRGVTLIIHIENLLPTPPRFLSSAITLQQLLQ